MLQIQLLGQFEVRADGKRISIASRPAQSLFAFLVLTAGTVHRREKLAGMFWPDTSDENARKNLRHELWRIRKAISSVSQPAGTDYLLADEFTLGFNRDAEYWLDVAQLERPDLDLPSLLSNLSAYQGELLPGFYEDWIALERERIQSVFEARMEQLLEQLIVAERWIAVQEWSERWLSFGNTPEPAYRALMLASGVRGDMAKVAAIYQRCTDELLEHLGMEPSGETRALYEGLRLGIHTPRSAALQQSGTITFLFTDIEGSTHLLDDLGNDYALVLAKYHEILRAAVQKWNGREVDTQGDAFFVTFHRALDAVQCVAEAQRALAMFSWPQDRGVHVRMGLHTGEPLVSSTGYVGMDVHRAARLGDAGHGGQVLLSQSTRELVIHDLPAGLTIRELGEHRLKDLKYPAPIYQLLIEGLPTEFPALHTKFTGTEAATPGEPPFKGLQYFDEADSDLFFGRELLTAKLVDRLRELSSSSEGGEPAKFLSVIIGASGSGKSSLVRAGLIPALKKGQLLMDGIKPPEGSADWQVHIITPTAHPLEALATELTRASESVTATATLMDDLIQDPRSLTLFLARPAAEQHTLLVLDQFEELFTLCRDEFEREAFIDNLLTALDQSGSKVTIILTLRADFYAHLAQYPELRDAVAKQQEYIGPMTADELRRAIEEPVKRGHWEFEEGLVDLILRDIGDEPGALPLLSHALLETWKRRAGHRLTLKGYADAGGVRGAIAHTAENVYQNLSMDEQIITRNLFLRLTELGEGTEDTRRRASFNELMVHTEHATEVRAVMNILAEARLITLGEDTAEVAHEALIREWPTLREWLNQDREGLQLHRHLTEATHEWEVLDREIGVLYRGSRLSQAREWAILHPNLLNAGERAFIEASNELEQREQTEREAQIQRELEAAKELAETQSRAAKQLGRRAVFLTGAFVLAIVLAGLAIFFGGKANHNARQAQVERLIATSRELAAAAISSLEEDPERSILLALQAEATMHTPEAENALHRSILASHTVLVVHNGAPVWDVTFSPDGTRFATTSQDKTAKVWDAKTGQLLLTLIGHTDQVAGIVYSPDGKRIATTSDDQTARIWDATTGQLLLTLAGHTGGIRRSAFSPDGTRLATISTDKTTRVWNAMTGKELQTFTQPAYAIDVAFHPDGHRIATSGSDGNVRIWDATTGKESLVLTVASELETMFLWGIAFSSDGKRVALAGEGINPVKIWDATTGELLLSGDLGHAIPPIDIAFSPDGKLAITGGYDQKAKVWDTTSGQVLYTLSGHTEGIIAVAFSPDGTRVATAGSDGTARIWDVTPAKELLFIPFANPEINWNGWLSYNADGTRLVTDYTDSNARIWDAASGKELMQLGGFTANTGAVQPSYSPDGKLIAAGNGDNKIIVWDAQTGEQLTTLVGFKGWARHIAFSPDGTRLASANDSDGTRTSNIGGTVTIWDLAGAKALLTIQISTYGTTSVAYSPDGKYLIAGEWGGLGMILDASNGNKIFILPEQSPVTAVSYSPDGKLVATGRINGIVTIWNALTGKKLLTLKGHTGWVNAVPFSPDGKLIATVAEDGTARVWDAATGENLLTLPVDPQGVGGVSFSPDGKRLAIGGYSGIYVLALPIEDVIALAKARVTRTLTLEECQQYLHMEQCPSQP